MHKLKYFVCYCLLSLGLFACAQSRPPIKNISATYREVLPGNMPVDANGNEISARDTINFIYVETAADGIQWNAAWKNDKTYSIICDLIDTNYFDAGINKITSNKITIQVSPGNKLWQLRLIPSEKRMSPPKEIAKGAILLQGTFGGKKMLKVISEQVEINSIPSQ